VWKLHFWKTISFGLHKMTLSGLHQLCVFIRVQSSRVPEVIAFLAEHKIKPQQVTTMPFSDGEKDQVLFIFSCSKPVQATVCKLLREKGIGEYGSDSDVSVIPLALAKDVRHQTEKEKDEAELLRDRQRKGTMQNVFQSTIKARIAVENVRFIFIMKKHGLLWMN
jgi:hypothetical protein